MRKKQEQELASLLVERFPLDLRRQLRAIAARTGRTLREAMIEAAEEWAERNRAQLLELTPAQDVRNLKLRRISPFVDRKERPPRRKK